VVVLHDRDSVVCLRARVGVKSVNAKPRPEMVTEAPPVVGEFEDREYEITAESNVKTDASVPTTVSTIARRFNAAPAP